MADSAHVNQRLKSDIKNPVTFSPMMLIIRNISVQAYKLKGRGQQSGQNNGAYDAKTAGWGSEACWETALRQERKCVILTVTFLNKHHQSAQCETAAAMNNSPV